MNKINILSSAFSTVLKKIYHHGMPLIYRCNI